tara:strand:- start:564 stop:935 length:372 start_codon:yes stop_codon:yes gene_type:complete
MKYKYDNLVSIDNNGYKVEVNENNTDYIISYGKNTINDFNKKAKRWPIKDKDSKQLFNTMENICMKFALDWETMENQLNKAIKSADDTSIQTKETQGGIYENDGWIINLVKGLAGKISKLIKL